MREIQEGTQVIVVIGSESDQPELKDSGLFEVLEQCSVTYHASVISADRNPDVLRDYCQEAVEAGVRVVIAGAGRAARLPGTIAAHLRYLLPVIGVALPSEEYPDANDARLSITRSPAGCPVIYGGDSKAGFKNAALIAVQILANGRDEESKKIKDKLVAYFGNTRQEPQIGFRKSERKER